MIGRPEFIKAFERFDSAKVEWTTNVDEGGRVHRGRMGVHQGRNKVHPHRAPVLGELQTNREKQVSGLRDGTALVTQIIEACHDE